MDEGYVKIRKFRDRHIKEVSLDHVKLNQFHDEIMKQVLELSILRISEKYGPLPCPFCFFVMGSAGRFEQSVWSDQDHGIIYQQQGDTINSYFLLLGNEISNGLHLAGYDYCEGGVMSSNPLWCKSHSEWQQQLSNWTSEASWGSICQLLIFIDGRSIFGEAAFVEQLKTFVFQTIQKKNLLAKILNNTLHFKKGIGVLGQLLAETHGPYTGSLNIKEKALFPYVNAIRLLSIKGNILETSTLSRLERLPETWISTSNKDFYKQQIIKLLNLRLSLGNHTNYESGHFLNINSLTKEQKKEMKEILKNGASLYRFARKLVEQEINNENG